MYFDIFLSNQPFPSCTQSIQYLYCGPKHGIISEESDGKLYQLRLNEIKNRNFRFKLLTDLTDITFDSSSSFTSDLKMTYLQNKEKYLL